MKCIINTLIILLLSYCSIVAQNDSIRKYWDEKELSFNDFKGKDEGLIASSFNYAMEYSFKTKNDGQTINNVQTESYFYPELSWISSNADSALTLKYYQTVFNILEYHSRYIQNTINKQCRNNLSVKKAESLFDSLYYICNTEIHDFMIESSNGTIDSIVHYEYDRSKALLKIFNQEAETVTTPPDFSKALFLDLGIGTTFLHGNMKKYLGQEFTFLQMSVGLRIDKWLFEFKNTAGFHKAIRNYDHNQYSLDKDTLTSTETFTADVGYLLYETPKTQLYSYAGIGYIRYYRKNKYEPGFIEGPYKFLPTIGLISDNHLKYLLDTEMELYLRARLSYQPIWYLDELKGGGINFLFGIGYKI